MPIRDNKSVALCGITQTAVATILDFAPICQMRMQLIIQHATSKELRTPQVIKTLFKTSEGDTNSEFGHT